MTDPDSGRPFQASLNPFTDDVYAIAAHHGVPIKELMPAPIQGQPNLTVFMGSELVLRLPRTARAAAQLAKEAEVIPLVQDAGLPTSSLVSYDPTLHIARAPIPPLLSFACRDGSAPYGGW